MSLIVERDFNELEIAECKQLYNTLVRTHDKCMGSGIVHENGLVSDCDCEAVFKYIKILLYSRIPRRFWSVSFASKKDLGYLDADKKIFDKLFHFDKITNSFFVTGIASGGKTAALSLIGKIAIWKGQNVFYLTPEDLLDFIRKDSENKNYLDRFFGADIILFDGLNKYNKSEWATGQIEFNLRKIYDGGANLFVSSSQLIDEMNLPEGLSSFMQKLENMIIVQYQGKEKLKLNDYLGKPLVDEARKYFKESLKIMS